MNRRKKQTNTYEGLGNGISFDGAFGAEGLRQYAGGGANGLAGIFTSDVQVEMASERFWIQ